RAVSDPWGHAVHRLVAALRRRGGELPAHAWRARLLAEMDAPVHDGVQTTPVIEGDRAFDALVGSAMGIYRANEPKYVDPVADAELIRFHDHGIALVLSMFARIVTHRVAG